MSARRGARGDALRELAAAIAASTPSAEGVSFAHLLPDVCELGGFTYAGVNRPVPEEHGWSFELDVMCGVAPEDLARLRAQVVGRTGRWTAYDPVLPETRQRDVVLGLGDLPNIAAPRATLDAMFAQIGAPPQDQVRALVCDGPQFLAWFGAFREEPFTKRDHAVIAALLPAVRTALRNDALARQASFLRDALATSLALLEDPAFLLDARGRVRHANPRGAAQLDRAPATREKLADIARGARPAGVIVQPIEQRDAMIVVLRTPGPDPGTRPALARREWGLTPRQTEILAHLLRGRSNKEIAAELACSEANVEAHLTQIFRKARADGRADLIARAWAL